LNPVRLLICLIALVLAAPLSASAQALAPRDVVARALDAVVQIEAGRPDGADPFAGSALGAPTSRPRARLAIAQRNGGGGSGFIFDASGLIATNAHVVAGSDTLRVRLRDGQLLDAELVGQDPVLDLAVLRIRAGAALPTLPFGSSGAVMEGDAVWALGAPLGYGFSVTAGVLSGRDRLYGAAFPIGLLQHDAALNPGSSGGPLIDAAGRVIGINTATPPETLFDIGIGLAIPVEVVARILPRLARDGRIARGTLGLTAAAADLDVSQALGSRDMGLLIDNVQPAGGAAQAGLRPGDLLLQLNDTAIRQPRDLVRALLPTRPGQRVDLHYVRDGQRQSVTAVLSAALETETISHVAEPPLDLGLSLGIAAEPGVLVDSVAPKGVAERYGLRAGDLIRAINGQVFSDASAALNALNGRASRVAVLRVERRGQGAINLILPLTQAAVAARPVGRVVDAVAGPF
jgi:serine protease Do